MEENAAHTVRAEILIETDSDEAAEKAVTDALLATPGVFLVTIHREVEYSNQTVHPGDDDVYAGTDIAPYEMTPVERWRCNAFLNAGFDPHAAERLALSNADVHKTIRALGNGCSLELALEIFL